MFGKIFLLLISASYMNGQDSCVLKQTGEASVCIPIDECEEAKHRLHMYNEFPQTCGFVVRKPKVCCPKSYKPGEIARKACNEIKAARSERRRKRSQCPILGGCDADLQQFKFMAIIGYGGNGRKMWGCGGTLISEQYVLTAAHCLNSRQHGLVKHVRVGEVDYSTNDECTHCQDFSVADRIVYPGYNFSCKYHDIALLKLDRPALITDYVEPACLHTGETIDFSSSVTVAGWGATGNRDCNKAYQNNPKIPKGVLDQYQICAGTHTGDKDTCRGDSGGPLLLTATHVVIGVTSFGKACGFPSNPGIYTKVYGYIQWIENNVWKK